MTDSEAARATAAQWAERQYEIELAQYRASLDKSVRSGGTLAAFGGILNSALYLAAVFVAALIAHNRTASSLAIMAFGLTYLSYLGQSVIAPRRAMLTMLWLSIAAGLAAGLVLLAGYRT